MAGPIKDNILKIFGKEPESLDELARCVIAVINSQPNRDPWHKPRKNSKPREYNNHEVVSFAWEMSYSDKVSNTHSAPEGYPQNWGCEPELPHGYPGWTGRVWIRYREDPYSFSASGAFEKTLTFTGTGGGGSYDGPSAAISSARFHRYGHSRPKNAYPEIHCFSWDYRFYDLDWPELATWVEKMKMWAELSGQKWTARHRFDWANPDVIAEDNAFMEECRLLNAKKLAKQK